MTKDWEDVREDIRILYMQNRYTLSAIQEKLRKERQFEASIRSYRQRIKAWKIRHNDPGPSHSSLQRQLPSFALESREDTRSVATQLNAVDEHPPAAVSQSKSRSLDELFAELSYSQGHGRPMDTTRVLESCHFREGTTNILHFAVQEPTPNPDRQLKLINEILLFMKQRSIDVDFRDSKRRTALEVAVLNDKVRYARSLLDSGAHINRSGTAGSSLLQMALLASLSVETIDCLMRKGANPNLPFGENHGSSYKPTSGVITTPRSFVVGQLDATKDSADDLSYWLKIAGVLAEHGAFYGPEDQGKIIRRFAKCWRSSFERARKLYDGIEPLLATFLRGGLDPTQPMGDRAGWHADSLFHLAVFHSPNKALARLIIENSHIGTYGSAMLKCILTGCREVEVASDAAYKLLCLLLEQPFELDWRFAVVEHALLHITRWNVAQRPDVLSVVLEKRPEACVVASDSQEDHWILLESLAKCDNEASRYHLAELVLQQRHLGTVSLRLFEATTRIKSIIWTMPQLPELLQTLQYPGGPHEQEVLQCILHVVTRLLIQGLGPGEPDAGIKLRSLLKMRDEHKLPDIEVPNKLMFATVPSIANSRSDRHRLHRRLFSS